jgi:hypothetical protein
MATLVRERTSRIVEAGYSAQVRVGDDFTGFFSLEDGERKPLAPGDRPRGVVLGPVSGECPAGYAIIPDIEVSNPSIEEILDGRDRQLDAARVVLSRK